MPKRKNEFDELPCQSKIHVGIKEVNCGVNQKENMRKVFEKTHAILFNGKANHRNGNSSSNTLHQNSVLEAKKISKPCCLAPNSLTCSFCERAVCFSCSRSCNKCNLQFCHLCSILQYTSHEEAAVCLSCM